MKTKFILVVLLTVHFFGCVSQPVKTPTEDSVWKFDTKAQITDKAKFDIAAWAKSKNLGHWATDEMLEEDFAKGKADVNAKDQQADSPFLYAAAEGRYEILLMTLAHGADLAATNRYGGTALIPACHYGHIEVVYALLKTKIKLDHVNHLGWTALLEAVVLGDGGPTYIEIVDALVAAGASAGIADRDGTTPLAHARRRGFHEIAAILERKKQK